MILRLEFDETPAADSGRDILIYSKGRHTCLYSDKASRLESKDVTTKCGDRVLFWYVDEGILEEMWFGVEKSLNYLRSFPGVKEVKILHEMAHFNPWEIQNDYRTCAEGTKAKLIGHTFLPYV